MKKIASILFVITIIQGMLAAPAAAKLRFKKPMPGGGSYTYVQSNGLRTTGTSVICTLSATSAGDLIGITAFFPTDGVTGASVTDSASEVYSAPTGGHAWMLTYFKANNVGGVTSITISSTSSQISGAICFDYSPPTSGTSPQDGNLIDSNQVSATTYTSGAITGTTGTADLVLGFILNFTNSTNAPSPNAPFAVRKEYVDSGAGVRYSMVDTLNTNPSGVANSGSWGASITYDASIIAFYGVSASGPQADQVIVF